MATSFLHPAIFPSPSPFSDYRGSGRLEH